MKLLRLPGSTRSPVTSVKRAPSLTMSLAIAENGLINRGAKRRTDLYFLNQTACPAILIEVCFVDSEADVDVYKSQFDAICESIAATLMGEETEVETGELFRAEGSCSSFGGPEDEGVSADEGLAFIQSINEAPQLFLPYQPPDTTGLARRLNPFIHYVACRWDYGVTPKEMLREGVALVRAVDSGLAMAAFPADWGPHVNTGRVADISPGLMADLGITTDDEVEVIFPYPEET